jgi:ComF family protein
MMTSLRRVEQALLDIVFPPRCVNCRRNGDYFCSDCRTAVVPVTLPMCDLCGGPVSVPGLCSSCLHCPAPVDGVRSVAFFEDPLRRAIHAFKYEGVTALRAPLGELLVEGWRRFRPSGDVIMPVPLHSRRARQRGYNQSALLAQVLSQHTGIPVLEKVLMRVRETLPQVELDAQHRWDNVDGAFECRDADEIGGRAVLLIDDVCTTGATINACADALRPFRPSAIWALTLGRTR